MAGWMLQILFSVCWPFGFLAYHRIVQCLISLEILLFFFFLLLLIYHIGKEQNDHYLVSISCPRFELTQRKLAIKRRFTILILKLLRLHYQFRTTLTQIFIKIFTFTDCKWYELPYLKIWTSILKYQPVLSGSGKASTSSFVLKSSGSGHLFESVEKRKLSCVVTPVEREKSIIHFDDLFQLCCDSEFQTVGDPLQMVKICNLRSGWWIKFFRIWF